jgi:hypothetical protein
LKTKTIQVTRQTTDVPTQQSSFNLPQRPSSRASSGRAYSPTNTNDNSVISISDLKDLQNGDFSAPKRGRKKKSDKSLNTVNINI